MPTRAEVIALAYLEREVKRLKRKVTALEQRLKSEPKKSGKSVPASPARSADSGHLILQKKIDRLQKQRSEDAQIIDEQRETISALRREARKRVPREILRDALSASPLAPMSQRAISGIIDSGESFDLQMVALLKAYDIAVRAARKNIVS